MDPMTQQMTESEVADTVADYEALLSKLNIKDVLMESR